MFFLGGGNHNRHKLLYKLFVFYIHIKMSGAGLKRRACFDAFVRQMTGVISAPPNTNSEHLITAKLTQKQICKTRKDSIHIFFKIQLAVSVISLVLDRWKKTKQKEQSRIVSKKYIKQLHVPAMSFTGTIRIQLNHTLSRHKGKCDGLLSNFCLFLF